MMHNDTPTDAAPGRHLDIERAAAEWLARRDGGGGDSDRWSATDEAALEAWLTTDTAHRVAFLRLQSAWAESGRLQALGAGLQAGGPPPRGHWHAAALTRNAVESREMRRRRYVRTPWFSQLRIAGAAAAVVFVLAGGWAWQVAHHVDVASYRTAVGEVLTQPLLDGSRVTLASNSDIDVRLSRGERHIDLVRGEAIFAVSKDASRPFVVASKNRLVIAVGTRFSVRRDDIGLRVVVTEGTVRLESARAGDSARPSALLPAGSVALVHGDEVLVRSLPLADAERMLGWRDGLLAFRDTPLAEAAAEFNRYNTRQIVIDDDQAGALRVGGSFRWDNADGFVHLVEQGFPVRADYHDDRIVLHSR